MRVLEVRPGRRGVEKRRRSPILKREYVYLVAEIWGLVWKSAQGAEAWRNAGVAPY